MNRRLTTPRPSRRAFLASSAAASADLLAPSLTWARAPSQPTKRPRVAAVFTVLRFRSHAYNILENFLGPYYFSGKLVDPGVDVVAMYADQFPDQDMAREVSRRFNIPLYETIDETLCVGGKELAVDAVLAIGEHGDYPFNERGQQLYPRKEFFDQSVAVMRRAGRWIPYFNDKHYSYRWDWAREMVRTAREQGMPLMGGSSVPLASRKPPMELPAGCQIEEAVSIHGGGLETYDFHGLELLQSMVERRAGGETGIARIELLIGDDFERARRDGRWSQELAAAAMAAETAMQAQRQQRPSTGIAARTPLKEESTSSTGRAPRPDGPHAVCITYRDGLRATVLKVGSDSNRWNFACKLRGETKPRATALFNSPWGNRGLFKALSHAIQHLYITGKEPYPAERTLLTTGALEAVMQSYEQDGKPIETPELAIEYQTGEWSSLRETGATWKVITAETPQPVKFSPRSFDELKR